MLGAIALFLFAIFCSGWAVAARLFFRVRALAREIRALDARLHALERRALPIDTPTVEAPPLVVPEPEPEADESHAPVLTATPSTIAVEPTASPIPAALPRQHEDDAQTIESWIGGQWLLYIGVLAILIGVAYFEKLAFESEWLGETARVLQGAVAGGLLVYAGTRFVRAGYRGYGQAIAGAGIAALFVSIYASFNYYHLIDRPVAFALMLLVTAGGVFLAARQDAQALAVLAVGGGFLTPFLLPGTADAEIALFGYDAVLVAGAGALARRRDWGLLYAISYLATLLTAAAWADQYYTPEKYLVTEVFLTAFCAMFVFMLVESAHSTTLGAQFARLFLLTAPFAYYFASIIILFDHSIALLVWLLAVATVAAVWAVNGSVGGALLVWAAAAVPLTSWATTRAAVAHLDAGLWTTAGMYAITLAAQLQLAPRRPRSSIAQIVWLHANGLVMFAAAYVLLLPNHVAWTAPSAAAFAAWHAALAAGLWRRSTDLALHAGALALTLVAIAIALQFDGAAVTIGWGLEGALIVFVALRTDRDWIRAGGLALFALATIRAVDLLLAPPVVGQAVLMNRRAACAVVLITLAYWIAWLHRTRREAPRAGLALGAATLTAQVLTLVWLTSEIRASHTGADAALARELLLSVTWASYATALILIGLWRRYAPIRLFAIGVLAVTIVKVFAIDLAHLERVYRVLSVLGLGLMLLLTSYLYQRFRAGTALGSSGSDDDPRRETAPDRS